MLRTDAMPQIKPKRFPGAAVSQVHEDLTNDKYRDLRRPKRVTFFCNGDKYFKGKLLFITPHRYLSFQDLLGDLTGKLPTTSSLPYGVRQIFTPTGGHRIRDIEHLEDGKEYVCAGFESFKALSYGSQSLDPWSNGRPHRHVENPSSLDLKGIGAFPSNSTSSQNYDMFPQRKPLQQINDIYSLRNEDKRYGTITKPKVITVVRAGQKPYANIKILLNRRSVQSYERLLLDISESFGPKWKNTKVRSLYTLTGREVLSISDFFRGDSIFIAVGNEKISLADVQEIIETLYPESPYAKSLLRNIEKQKRKAKEKMLQSLALENQDLNEKQDGTISDTELKQATAQPNESMQESPKKRNRQPKSTKPDFSFQDNQENVLKYSKPVKLHQVDVDNSDSEKPKRIKKASRPLPDIGDSYESLEELEAGSLTKQVEIIKSPLPELLSARKSDDDGVGDDVVDEEINLIKEPINKTKRQRREEKQKQLEKQQQQKREAETKANQELYRALEKKVNELANKNDDTKDSKSNINVVQEKPKPKLPQVKSKLQRTVEADEIKEKYDIGRTLGDGNFAVVKMCQHRDTGYQYAMKIIDKAKLKGKEQMIDNEIAIMKACDHENLVKLLEEYETREEIYLVMELIKGGDLFDAIAQSIKFPEPVAAKMTLDIANALFYLHSRGIVHRDLKPENLMVMRNKDDSITLKLCDFGLAVEVKAPIFTICGTPTYVAPEILSEVGYGLEVDLWALGVITYILLCGFPPFRSPDRNQTELFEFIKAGQYEFLSPYWDNTSTDSKDLIRRLLVVDKKSRFTASDVICNLWIITMGGSKAAPPNLSQYVADVKEKLAIKAKDNLEEWKANRSIIFANLESSLHTI